MSYYAQPEEADEVRVSTDEERWEDEGGHRIERVCPRCRGRNPEDCTFCEGWGSVYE